VDNARVAARRPKPGRGLPAVIGLGIAGGMRTFVPPAAIALRDRRPSSGLARLAIVVASAGELALDKYPGTPSRTEPAGLAPRFASSGVVGWACAGPIGGLLAGATAIGSAFVMHDVRRDLGRRTGLPDAALGAAEDVLAIVIARTATRRPVKPAPAESPRPAVGPAASQAARAPGRRRCRCRRRSRG
jgi:hypothetical protein